MLKSREQIIQEKLGSVNESVFKIGDIYKVKTVIEVPKSLINAFVSKSKKEHDVDPRESWSDMDLAELFVNYVNSNFMNIDSIPVDAIMGEKDNRAKSDSSVIVTDTTTEEPLQQTTDVTASTETPIENQEEPKTQEETRIANIPTELQVESKVNESSDFIMNYSDELKDAVEKMKSIQSIEIEDVEKLKELEQKVAPIMARYDKNVEDFIFNGDASVDGIVKIGFDNQYRYGTEPQFIIDAIDSMYHMYVRLGILDYKQTDEKMETFMINASLTDVLKDHLNENHIEYDQSAGILEITTTKSKLKKIKEIL